METASIVILLIIFVVACLLATLLYYSLRQKTSSSSPPPQEPYHESCNSQSCNNFIHDNIINKNRRFQTSDDTPCRGCHPYFSYSWTPDHGLAYNKGPGWIPCETKENCFDILKHK
jgi:hypothetical protein